MILMIDNYDSFTYNLVHSIRALGEEVIVERNDALCLEDIRRLEPTAIFLSPGPCSPKEAGISVEVIRHFFTDRSHHGGLPGAPGHWIRLWWRGGEGQADHARQDLPHFP